MKVSAFTLLPLPKMCDLYNISLKLYNTCGHGFVHL
jgi:hypothetical protein